jgi:hypothetical protein
MYHSRVGQCLSLYLFFSQALTLHQKRYLQEDFRGGGVGGRNDTSIIEKRKGIFSVVLVLHRPSLLITLYLVILDRLRRGVVIVEELR